MRQTKALFLAMAVWLLSACSNPQYLLHPTSNPAAAQSRQTLDKAIDTTMLQPVSWGSFLFPVKGTMFKPVYPLDSRNAIVYVYRPQSAWNDQEIQSPGFFVNGEHISGLKSGSYFWFEVPASTYNFAAKRPLAILYFNTIFSVDATFVGGERYYFRYDEENPGPKKPVKGSPLLVVGPLQQVAESQALQEITRTRSMGIGRVLLADYQPQWAPFEFYPDAQPVPKDSVDAAIGLPTMLRSEEEIQFEKLADLPVSESSPATQDAAATDSANSDKAPAVNKSERHWWKPGSWW